MRQGGNIEPVRTLEELCREASLELDSRKLAALVEEIDRLLDAKHKAQRQHSDGRVNPIRKTA